MAQLIYNAVFFHVKLSVQFVCVFVWGGACVRARACIHTCFELLAGNTEKKETTWKT